MPNRLPLLVVAQSGRFIAQSAIRAGYTVWVADCFGDQDTLAVAERWQRLTAINELTPAFLLDTLEQLSAGQPCLLICGSGVESFYPALSQLPAHITLIGNSAQLIATFRDPASFFSLLDKLALPYPVISHQPPSSGTYLVKNLQSAGGSYIVDAEDQVLPAAGFYQQWIDGESRSVCFIADGLQAEILGWNRQENRQGGFLLQAIWQPDLPGKAVIQQLKNAVSRLVSATGLRGFNSLDFMVDKTGQLYILEINPRLSASVELLDQPELLKAHISACNGEMPYSPASVTSKARLLYYLFADSDLLIKEHPVWPDECHDVPAAASIIRADEPICTLIVRAESPEECQNKLQQVRAEALKNCLPHA